MSAKNFYRESLRTTMKKICLALLCTLVVAFPSFPLPSLLRGDLEVYVDEAMGTINIRYYTSFIEGKIAIWGPNFYYDSTYWGSVSGAFCEPYEEGLRCYAESPDGSFSWTLKPIVGPDFVLYEYVVTAESNWTYNAVAWVLDLPVDSFAGESVFAVLLPYGSTEGVALRREHVPGQPDLRSSGSGAGWVVPIGFDIGVTTALFCDAAARVNIAATDEREWGGNSYRLRFYYPGEWGSPKMLKPGDELRFYIYIHTFTSRDEREFAQRRVFSISYLRDVGLPSSEILDLVLKGEIEKYLEEKGRERQTLLLAYILAAVFIAVVAAVLVRRRRLT